MKKAKTIDRLEMTRRKFGEGGIVDRTRPKDGINHSALQECPHCGARTLRLDSGCMSCLSCGWSACG